MNIISVPYVPTCTDYAPVLNEILSEKCDDAVIKLEKGDYPILSPVKIENRENLTIDGDGAVFVPHYDREADYEKSSDVFHIRNCKNLTLCRFGIDASMPACTGGKIINVGDNYVDVLIESKIPFNGNEHCLVGKCLLPDGRAANGMCVRSNYDPAIRTVIEGEIACSAPRRLPAKSEMIGDQIMRFYSNPPADGTEEGMRCVISHTYYGLVAFVFRSCEDVTIEDVHIKNFGGFGFLILPRCKDFTFRRVRIASEDTVRQPYSTTSDGIHTIGLGGNLTVDNCYFQSLGDDTINVHTQVMTVTEADKSSIKLIYDKIGGFVSPIWALPGDVLRVYDPETLALKGTVKVISYSDGCVICEPLSFDVSKNDYITNSFYFPDIVFKDTTIRFKQGRSSCFQAAESLLFENCRIECGRGAAVYLSTAFDHWMEAGPLKNVTVRRCSISGSGVENPKYRASIQIWVNGERHKNARHIHKNITIEDNVFEKLMYPVVYAASADNLTIRNNILKDCPKYEPGDILLHCCNDVKISGNKRYETGEELSVKILSDSDLAKL